MSQRVIFSQRYRLHHNAVRQEMDTIIFCLTSQNR
jgi:hypothetical protein